MVVLYTLAPTVQPLNNPLGYKMDLDIKLSFCGSQFFLPWNFTKELLENDHKIVITGKWPKQMVIFLIIAL